MKIAIVAPEVFSVPAIRGGAIEAIVQELAVRLAAEHEIHVFSIADPQLPLEEVRCSVQRPSAMRNAEFGMRSENRATPNSELRTPNCACSGRAGHVTYHRWRPNLIDRLLLSSWKLPFKQSRSRWYYRPYSRWVAAHLARLQPDIVHVMSRIQFVPWIRRAVPRATLVLGLHQLSSLDGPWTDKTIRACDVITGCSPFMVEEMIKRHPAARSKARVLPNGIDVSCRAPWWDQLDARRRIRQELGLGEGPVILYAGRLVEQKGVHLLAKAFEQVLSSWDTRQGTRDRGHETGDPSRKLGMSPMGLHKRSLAEARDVADGAPQAIPRGSSGCRRWGSTSDKERPTLLIVGSHTYSDETQTAYIERLKEQVRPFGCRVVWAGYQPSDKMAALYAAADVVVVPSIGPEAFSMVIVEAMASGLPVVAFAHGGPRELIEHERTGRLVPLEAGSAGLAEALAGLLRNESLRRRCGEAGRRAVETRFTWQAVVERAEELYEIAASARSMRMRNAEFGMRSRTPNSELRTPNSVRVLIAESGSGYGGSAKYLSELVSRLDRARYDVTVAAAELGPFIRRIREQGIRVSVKPGWRFPWGHETGDTGQGRRDRGQGTGDERRATSDARRINSWARCLILGGAQLLIMVPAIAAWLKRRRIALVHLNNEIYSHLPLLLGAKLAGCRVVCHLHGWRSLTRTERWAIRFVDELVCISRAGARYYSGQLHGRWVSAVPNGIALNGQMTRLAERRAQARARLDLQPGDVAVALIGRLVPWKGQHVFLRALASALENTPRLMGLVVGHDATADQSYLTRLHALAEDLGLTARVRFLPWQDDVWSIYAAADIVVHASTQPEPFGLVLLEAMAAGKPVIATRAGGVVDIVVDGETGVLVEPGSVEALARAVRLLAQDHALASRLAHAASARVQTAFSIDRNAAGMMAVYARVTDARSGRGATPRPIGAS